MSNEQSTSALGAVLNERCPKCRQGKVFKSPAWKYKGFLKMHENCDSCGLRFEREPGFFFGAMYISYAFNVAIFVNVSLLIWFFTDSFPIWAHIATVFAVAAILLPFVFRYSRILYLYWFGGIKHDPKASQKETLSES